MDTTPQNIPLGTPFPPPTATPVQPQTTKSGCGCCGCFFGCAALILIPVVLMVVLYYVVDFGKVGDRAFEWSYHELIRPRILEEALKGSTPEQRRMALEISDHFMKAYMDLPGPERKNVREEALLFLYYNSQNLPVPPEKIVHLNQFIQNQMVILKRKYPDTGGYLETVAAEDDVVMQTLQRHPNLYFKDYQDRLGAQKIDQWMQEALKAVIESRSLEDWERSVLSWNEIKAHVETHGETISLAFNRNTQDGAAEAEQKRFHDEIEPPYKQWNAKIREKILNSPLRAELEKKFGSQYFVQLQVQQDSFNPKNVELETKLNDILSDYTKLTGQAQFELKGERYPLAHYKKFSCSPDETVRREGLQGFSGWFLQNRPRLEEIYDRSVDLRTRMGKELGHPNFIPLAYQKMRRTDYGQDEVAEFRRQIKEVIVPLTTRIRALQAKSLRRPTLPVWDSDYFPEWQVKAIKVGIPDQVGTGLKVFRSLSPRLGDYFKKMIDHDLIDVPARPGKAPGAFCTDFSDYRVPFVFLNSVGEVADVSTLLHESGHAFQAWESRGIDLMELRWPTLEACEVHSMGMEFLASPYYEEFFSTEDAVRFRKYHLAESLLIYPYIAVVDEFQHRVYSGEAKGAEGRAKAWEDLEKAYLPGLDYQDLKDWRPIRWLRQLHIFKHPFYYIDYAIALTGALQLWVQSMKDQEAAMENYLSLCKLGGTLPLKDFFKEGNLKLPFEPGVLKGLMEEVLEIEPVL